ncbi:MAG: HIT domain-containing protein [Spirochaetes bacterium]|nr:HIT domain-containing protein [Spirochaetota bacterium]
MKRLFAPWRIDYILSSRTRKCLFCSVTRQKKDKENLIIHRGKHVFVIMNKYPYNNGHIMVVPYKHTPCLEDLDDNTLLEMMKLTRQYLRKMKSVMKAHGFNIGINIGKTAGAGIKDHIHLHIVPRWEGDNNFMPVLGKDRILSESFESVYKKLK